MNRRSFCKLAALAAGFAAIKGNAAEAFAGRQQSTLRGCRVTVIRRQCFQDLQSRYLDDPELGPCSMFTEGQEFVVDSSCLNDVPAGFCPKAWKCICSHVAEVLDSDTGYDCGSAPVDHAVIACCNDGTRPVVFKISPIADDRII